MWILRLVGAFMVILHQWLLGVFCCVLLFRKHSSRIVEARLARAVPFFFGLGCTRRRWRDIVDGTIHRISGHRPVFSIFRREKRPPPVANPSGTSVSERPLLSPPNSGAGDFWPRDAQGTAKICRPFQWSVAFMFLLSLSLYRAESL